MKVGDTVCPIANFKYEGYTDKPHQTRFKRFNHIKTTVVPLTY